jgi:hypothetical protein
VTPTAQRVIEWFRNLGVTSGLNDMTMQLYTEQKLVEGDKVKEIVDLVTRLDLGILDLKIVYATNLLATYDPSDPAHDNPSTTVHLLVQELNKHARP